MDARFLGMDGELRVVATRIEAAGDATRRAQEVLARSEAIALRCQELQAQLPDGLFAPRAAAVLTAA